MITETVLFTEYPVRMFAIFLYHQLLILPSIFNHDENKRVSHYK